MTDETPAEALGPSDPEYWQALIESGYLARGLASLANDDENTVHWDQIETSGTMQFLKVKENINATSLRA